MQKIVVPAHFLSELEQALAGENVQLVPYDKDGNPSGDLAGVTGFFRWWLSQEAGDRIIREAPELKWIHTGSAGVEHILTPAFLEAGLRLTNSSGVHAPSIAEWVVAAMLFCEKDLPTMLKQQRRHSFEKVEQPELSQRTVLFIGAGHIARAIARRLRPFGPKLRALRRRPEADPDFDEVLPREMLLEALSDCHWVIVAAPLSRETRGMISAEAIGKMRRDARLVNVARGEIVDEAALIDALREKRIAGAVLDVFTTEPLPNDSPLWDLRNVLIFPHTTWRSPQVRQRQLDLFVENVRRFVGGKPLINEVKTEV